MDGRLNFECNLRLEDEKQVWYQIYTHFPTLLLFANAAFEKRILKSWPDRNKSTLWKYIQTLSNVQITSTFAPKHLHILRETKLQAAHQTVQLNTSTVSKLTWNWNKINPDPGIPTQILSKCKKTWARPQIMITYPFISIISVLWIRLNNRSHCRRCDRVSGAEHNHQCSCQLQTLK